MIPGNTDNYARLSAGFASIFIIPAEIYGLAKPKIRLGRRLQ
jgi:hypothetical protein